jgi:hypothetical protein
MGGSAESKSRTTSQFNSVNKEMEHEHKHCRSGQSNHVFKSDVTDHHQQMQLQDFKQTKRSRFTAELLNRNEIRTKKTFRQD